MTTDTKNTKPPGYRLRWRKNARWTGLAGIGQGPLGFKLFDANGNQFASVNALRRGGWYYVIGWTGRDLGLVPHVNTSDTPCASADEAKAEALRLVKHFLSEKKAAS